MLKKIKKISKSISSNKDGKTVSVNFGYLLVLQVSGYIFPLLTIPYLARVIGTNGFGKIAFASAVMVWFHTLTDWGFNYTATRDLSLNRDNPKKVSEIFSNVLWARILLMFFSLSILIITIYTIPLFYENRTILLTSFLLVPGWIFFPEWFFQAVEKMKFITVFSLISRAISTGLVFIYINNEDDYIFQPLFMGLGQILCGSIAMYIIIFKWKVKLHPPNLIRIFTTIKKSTDVFLNNLLPNLYNSFSIVLLSFFGGSVATGIFDAGNKFIEISDQFLRLISRAAFPLLSRKISLHNLYQKIYLYSAIIISFSLFCLADIIVNIFYTAAFDDAKIVLRILSVSIVFSALNSIYGINFMIIKGYEKQLRNITTIWSILGLIIAIPLIYYFGYIGTCVTILTVKIFLGLHTTFFAKRIVTL